MSDKTKFAFIICTNDEQAYREAEYYISKLDVPNGMTVEIIPIIGAHSMTEGYNKGTELTDAKYKIYIHQDLFVVNERFLHEVLRIFEDPTIGMIGMMGAPKMPENMIMWMVDRVGGLYSHIHRVSGSDVSDSKGRVGEPVDVEAIDGCCMITQYDIPWREDLFKGWDFYDVSQSYEFRKAGYRVVVPLMDSPWCMHDSGLINYRGYFDSRRIFLKEYKDMFR